MHDTSVEDIKALVKQEKQNEEELLKARDEANNVIEKAKSEAKRVLEEAEDGRQYEAIFEAESKKIEDRKKTLEKTSDEEIERVKKVAGANMEKAIALILKNVLSE